MISAEGSRGNMFGLDILVQTPVRRWRLGRVSLWFQLTRIADHVSKLTSHSGCSTHHSLDYLSVDTAQNASD